MEKTNSVIQFLYNADGIRTNKIVNGTDHVYTLNGTQIVSEAWGDNLLVYLYDESGSPIGMQYRLTSYASNTFDTFYFEKNLQGDVVAVYNENGVKVLSYTYDAWGNHTMKWHYTMGTSLAAQYNPFRYRGYYYDTETGLYYLQSRYYNPQWGRFLNADGFVNANGDLIGFNMYAYCSNNPVMGYDPTGEFAWGVLIGVVLGGGSEVINWVKSGEEFSGIHAAKIIISGVGGGLAAGLGPMGSAAVSFLTSVANSGLDGNDKKTALLDGFIGAASSCLGSAVSYGVGKFLAKRYISNASRTGLKTLANSLGYKGYQFKEAVSWAGDILFDASCKFMDTPLADAADHITSTLIDTIWEYKEEIKQWLTALVS